MATRPERFAARVEQVTALAGLERTRLLGSLPAQGCRRCGSAMMATQRLWTNRSRGWRCRRWRKRDPAVEPSLLGCSASDLDTCIEQQPSMGSALTKGRSGLSIVHSSGCWFIREYR